MLGKNHRLCIVRCDGTEHVVVTAPQGATVIAIAAAKPPRRGPSHETNRIVFCGVVLALALLPSLAFAQAANSQALTLDLTGGGVMTERLMQIVVYYHSLARTVDSDHDDVLHAHRGRAVSLRTAIGIQQSPPNSVIVSLALFLTFFVMAPTFNEVYQNAMQPLIEQKIDTTEALTRAPTR